ncbi:MAG: sulfatase-like hydrolase/transferase [Planctomycetales bacterium]|nr:sulfatase-like hydrolase/transferase [Planctomycetales bacterium]
MNRLLWIVLAVLTFASQTQAQSKPNILFIFSDDQCFETLSCLNNDEVLTPNLDRLVKRGTTFTHAYNMGSWSGAVCVASRTMLNTGRYLWYAHEIYNKSEQEREAGRFWSEHMREAGYRTYMTGKWHLKAKAENAFDVVRDVRPGMPNQAPAGYDRPRADGTDPWSPYDKSLGGFWKGGRHWSEIVADHGVDYLREAAKRPEPFFMYLAFNAPHDPRQAPKQYVDLYPAANVQVPPNFLFEYPHNEAMDSGRKLRDERLAPFPRTEYSVQVHRQEYYALITHMDAQVGRILDALDESGKADNTYIFFTADHGLAVGQHGLFGKQNMYDHSVRVPFMVVGPNIPADERNSTPIYLQDLMATSLELAKIEKPDHVQFQSVLPLLDGTGKGRDAIYGAYLEGQRMVTQGDYKLILYPKAKVVRLYNVKRDPKEMLDLASEGALPIMRRLFTRLLKLQQEVGDKLDIASVYPELAGDA